LLTPSLLRIAWIAWHWILFSFLVLIGITGSEYVIEGTYVLQWKMKVSILLNLDVERWVYSIGVSLVQQEFGFLPFDSYHQARLYTKSSFCNPNLMPRNHCKLFQDNWWLEPSAVNHQSVASRQDTKNTSSIPKHHWNWKGYVP
jgi:hypothetical protein